MKRDEFVNILTNELADEPNRCNRILEAVDTYVASLKQSIINYFNGICDGCTESCRDCRMTLYDIDIEDILKELCKCESQAGMQPAQKNDWLYDYLVMHLGKEIVDNKDKFHKWFERMAWHVKRCDELSAELRNRSKEPSTDDGDAISRRAAMLRVAKNDSRKYTNMSDFHDACVDCLKDVAGNDMDSDTINRQRTTIPTNPQTEDSMDAVIALITTALKKQVPMAHELRTVEVDKDGNALHDRFCPSCGHRICEENYCPHCGQALAWG